MSWSNAETRAMFSWMENDDTIYDEVQNMVEDARESDHPEDDLEQDLIDLADRENPTNGNWSVFADFIAWGLQKVDFYEIAEALLEEE